MTAFVAVTVIAVFPALPAGAAGTAPVSDDFHATALNTSLWSVENPVGDGSVALNGHALLLSVPAGTAHDMWTDGLNALRVVQPVANSDFEVETKFESMGSAQYQDQGIVVEQDASTLLRFDVYSTGSSVMAFAASLSGGTASVKLSQVVANAQQPFWLRVKRTGNAWLFTYSQDGVTWVTGASFTYAMTVAKIGPYAGNAGASPPAWTAAVDYFFNTASPIVPEDGGSGTTSAAKNDDFSAATLNASTWSFVNPGGGSTQSMDGSHAVIGVPAGTSHDPNANGDGAPRLMQTLPNVDFSVDAKFDSAVSQQFQEQGMVVEQDSTHYVHVDIVQNWYQTAFVVKTVSAGTVTTVANVEIYNKASIVLRVARTGNNWSFGYSYDGSHWTAAATLTQTLTVARAGVFGGNFGGSSSPAFTVKVDYFVNSTAPPATEDGVAWPTAPGTPVINLWNGSQQTFGANGQPQQWVNILGDVSDPAGMASLTYTLNGGSANALSMGENQVRLVEPGQFNVELDYASLLTGPNTVHLTATDNLGSTSTADVTVTKVNGGPWALPYTANWSQAGGNINSIAQIVDGHWTVQPDGTIHNGDFGYDRLVALGQASTWGQYEVTAQVTINAMDPDGSGVGIIAGWKGATNNLHGVVTADQPRIGHSFPGALVYDNLQGQPRRFEIYTNTDTHPEQTLAADTTGTQLTMGAAYTFKFRVTDNAAGGSDYKVKAWKTGTAEPGSWMIQASGELSRGSILLVAHRADVNFGTVTVNPIAGTASPVNTAVPTITGTAQQGQTLSVSTGTWTNSPTAYTYAWNRCSSSCTVISGATTSSYVLAAADVGSTITATVTASNAGGFGAPATSAATAPVAPVSGAAQTIAAGTSATNLPTENVWPGAQSPPYVCCWGAQGQYVTFSFSATAGSTSMALRYSAGNGTAHRKIELDGSVWVANQAFPATADWSTWTAVTLNQTLSAGVHTLKVWFDSTAGSDQNMNMDNLTVTPLGAPPAGVVVSVGYADSANGLTPWSGSANTTFIGEPAQCCATHGPSNGSPSYDAGAIDVANNTASSVTVNSVTVDFGGGSSPSHFDLWGGATTPHLPQTLAPGASLVLTMTAGFNFDTSDLYGEACNINSGVAGVVHVTVNGSLTDYEDSHQILNSDGTDLAGCPGDVSEQAPFTALVPGTQPAALPRNDVPPSVTAAGPTSSPTAPAPGRVVSGFAGGWNASPPPALALQWTRCDTSGGNCSIIAGATNPTYLPTSTDVGKTLRLRVTASNGSGSVALSSAPTPVVLSGTTVSQLGDTRTGSTATFVYNTDELSWITSATKSGSTKDFAFFARGAGNSQVFTPKIFSVVNGQKGNVLATGAAVTVPKGTDGRWYVSSLSGLRLKAGTKYLFALDPSGAFNGTYVGAETSGETSFFVDYS